MTMCRVLLLFGTHLFLLLIILYLCIENSYADTTNAQNSVHLPNTGVDPSVYSYFTTNPTTKNGLYDETGHRRNDNGQHKEKRYPIAKFDFDRISTPYIISLWIIIVGLAKIGFHVTPKLSSVCPESVVLMILGVIIGLIMFFSGISEEKLRPLTPTLFFLYMLPPIVMDAGYHMPNRLFFDNLISILLYAVIGTVWNALAIGLSLYGCGQLGLFGRELPLLDTLLFSSTVSAVDPVAVLAVFEEIHVNEVLYILVFGESLLNDAVTVVLYHMFEGYADMASDGGIGSILPIDYFSGFASFFVISLGGTFMGVIWGFLAAFVSRFTHHVKIIEPIFVFVMAYLSYLSAEMFHLSGILSLTFCGITMKNYVEENITQKSHTTLKYAMKMLANSAEAIIFVFLGVCTVNDDHHWNTAFVVLTIIFCLLYRAIGVIALTAFANRFRLHRLNKVEQFIMAYGGLRGAVAFALILIVDEDIIPSKPMMITTIIAVVYFTVFLQGMTVGSLVKILNVPQANKFELSMNERIHTRIMDHLMAGMEDICGMMVGNYKVREKFRYYNKKYLRVWLLRDSNEKGNSSRKIFETCSKLDLQDAIAMVNKQPINMSPFNNNNHLNVWGANNNIKSLSSLFRTYTQANLATIVNAKDANDDSAEVSPSSAIPIEPYDTFNYDIKNLAYSPSNKDLADSEIHHILSETMFKPVKKERRYSRSDLLETPSTHPPFQHQMRMQIRHLISQQNKSHNKRKHSKSSRSGNGDDSPPNGFIPNDNVTFAKKDFYLKPPQETHGYTSPSPHLADVEDDGIIFTVKSSQSSPDHKPQLPNHSHQQPQPSSVSIHDIPPSQTPSSPTVQETLPWRRDTIEEESSEPIRQEEFPPWIDNKEYIDCYASPTNTFLGKLDESKRNSLSKMKLPKAYEIFTVLENESQGSESRKGSRSGESDNSDVSKDGYGDTAITKGRFKYRSAANDETSQQRTELKSESAKPSPNDNETPMVAVNMGFVDDESNTIVYRL